MTKDPVLFPRRKKQQPGETSSVWRYIASLALLLAITWLLFSGMWSHPILLPLGALSVVFTIWLSHRLGILDRTANPLRIMLASLRYWPWLLVQIVQSSVQVARHALSPRLDVNPRIVRLPTTQQTDLGRAMLANSITLTPGTVSIYVRKSEIWFYALDAKSAEETASGEMDRRVRRFEEEAQ
ncbi:Na+/H+ antiporter subunit E [Thioalkalivibrio sp.]|uniref:Na+/H+ antiporter subunit E n=1 Tax=Thioalkalivibrio sp. TaxID=2093813 RepID=UPI003567B041